MNILFHLAISVFYITHSSVNSQIGTMSGEWAGYITQTPAGLAEKYDFHLNIKRTDDKVSGSSTIRMIDQPEYFGVMKITGEITDRHLVIEELEITEKNLFLLAYWCTKKLILDYKKEKGKEILSGYWESDDCNTSRGEIYLERILI